MHLSYIKMENQSAQHDENMIPIKTTPELMKNFADREVHQHTLKFMLDQYEKMNGVNDIQIPAVNFVLSKLMTIPFIQLTDDQVDKFMSVFTTRQMLLVNDMLQNGVTWF
jgi:hypothetical protein